MPDSKTKTKQKPVKRPSSKKQVQPKPNHKGLVKKFELKIKINPRKVLTWVLIGFLALSFVYSLRGPVPLGDKSLTQVLNDIKQDKIAQIKIEGDILLVEYKEGDLIINEKGSEHSLKAGKKGCEFLVIWIEGK